MNKEEGEEFVESSWDEESEQELFGVKEDELYLGDILAAKFQLERSLMTGVDIGSEIEAEAEREKKKVVGLGNVVGVGIGEKETSGRSTGRLGVRVYVVKKKPEGFAVASEAEVPPEINGIKTDVVEVGVIEAFADQKRYPRPVPAGCSVGHTGITAGTLGCLVRRAQAVYILSNNHVLANSNDARRGDHIVQPGPADGGQDPRDLVGRLENFVRLKFGGAVNLVDAAIATTSLTLARPEILQIGCPNRLPVAPSRNLMVKKRGRTTGLTYGTIADVNLTTRVGYGSAGWALFRNQILVRGQGGQPFSDGGDSGSLVLNHCHRPVGLLFAGNAQTNTTIVNRISEVLKALKVQMY